MIKFALMGHGVVGSGVAEVFFKHKEAFEKKIGDQLELKYILALRDFDVPYKNLFTKDFNDIINDDEIKIVVEVMGGVGAAYDFVKRCLTAGKSVATSNKELVATHGAELLKIAKEKNANFLFEASVGGGIPIIRPIYQCLSANEILEIDGILNGTTNYILTKMIKEQVAFDDALKTAQELGYAERDPSADVNGDDACRKICILAALAFGKHVYPDSVYTEGITKITLEDVEYANDCDCVIKLIGRAVSCDDGRVEISVYPAFVGKDSQLSSVDDVFNAVLVRGDAVGDAVFYGRGAGKLPTASAVVADVLDCAKHLARRRPLDWEDCADKNYVKPIAECDVKAYIRVKNGDLANIKSVFGDVKVLEKADAVDEIAFITNTMTEQDLTTKLSQVSGEVASKIRVLSEI